VQLHFGGGSPTFLRPDEIRRLGEIIHKHFTFAPDIEASVEVDPRRLTRDHMVALREIGFNRASMGVQDFNPAGAGGRSSHPAREMTQQAMDWMRELGYGSINLDLIYGLPHQTGVVQRNARHRADDETGPAGGVQLRARAVDQARAKDSGAKSPAHAGIETAGAQARHRTLTANDQYVYIGMDHFARPDDELAVAQRNKQLQRNFQGYSTRAGSDIYAFGMSSISQIPDAYWQNEKELPKYQAAVDADACRCTRRISSPRKTRSAARPSCA
jgi:oxygen-independent coproporphyrinogen III oxidase